MQANTLAEPAPFKAHGAIAQDLAAYVARQIVFLEIEPGVRLVEEDLGRQYGVSRSPVREAIRILENEGLVVREPRRGIWVAPLSRDDANEVYACRLPLEGLAAETAAKRAQDYPPNVLTSSLDDLGQSAGDVKRYFEANVTFTRAVREMAGNRTLSRLLDHLSKQGQRYRYLAYVKTPNLIDVSIEGNAKVAQAILQGKAARARSVTEDLIRNSWKVVLAHLEG